MKTFLKWAGNKSRIKDIVSKHIEPKCKFIEPFAGSCAISLNIDAKSYLLSDANQDLINLYNCIIQDDDFIEYAKTFFTEKNNTSEQYYELRETFNTTSSTKLKSALWSGNLNSYTFL